MTVATVRGGNTPGLRRQALVPAVTLVALCMARPCAGQSETAASDPEWAIIAPRATQSLLLDGAARPELAAVVGTRGHILISEDAGTSWTQVRVPTRRALCAVAMPDADNIWVVGHDALILYSDDRGRTWTVQHDAPEEESPLFDVWFEDTRYGIAIGAYGLFLETRDGGESWSKRPLGELDRHLYAITETSDGELYVAGESGTILRSSDRGATWTQLRSPYAGSFFGILALRRGALLVYGLRGNLYRSEDGGESWQRIALPVRATLLSGTRVPSGGVVLVGLSGSVFFSDDDGAVFEDRSRKDRVGISAALFMANERLLLIGESGVNWFGAAERRSNAAREGTP